MVSVIIPNYNHADYLEQRIESVLSQTWRKFEIILLDDCSTDNSRSIIEKYRGHEKVVSIIYNDENSGSTFLQWQKGIEESAGEFVWIAESDDWCEPSFLQTMMDGIADEPSCMVGYCQSYCIHDRNIVKWKSHYSQLADYLEGLEFNKKFMLMNTAIFNASMAVWRRSAYDNISKEFTTYRYCGDWLFWIEVCRQGKVFISGKLLNYFRMHSNDVSTKMFSSGNGLLEEITLFKLLLKRKWIERHEFLKIISHKYQEYRSARELFSTEKQAQLESALTQETGLTKAKLETDYLKFYLKHGVRNFLNRITG